MVQPATSVSVDFVTRDGKQSRYGGGALQVSIEGERLNRYVDEEQLADGIYWKEYAGDFLFGDLYTLLETTVEIIADPVMYEEHVVQFEGYDEYLLLEYLGESTIRVAYRIPPDAGDDSFDFRAVPSSACGYPVGIEDWGTALQDAVERFQDELRAAGEQENADWFEEELAELRTYLSQ